MTTTTAQWFGHPRGLSTLFFTELWERFSYYGMRALLLLYMTDVATGGLDLGTERSSAIYGLYTFGVYALALPGGWVADRILGQKKAVLWGGIIIALGHYALAVPSLATFFLGLFLVVVGTGLLKPNVSAVVGDLYVKDTAARRDAGFSIFYSGINIGALAGPLVCSYLGENVDWHLGFGAAGVGMTAAIVAYVRGQKHLEGAGDPRGPAADPVQLANAKRSLIAGTACIVVLTGILWWLGSERHRADHAGGASPTPRVSSSSSWRRCTSPTSSASSATTRRRGAGSAPVRCCSWGPPCSGLVSSRPARRSTCLPGTM